MKKLIIANWKLNPSTLSEAKRLAASIERTKKNIVVLCPPTIYLSQIDYPNLGAQDCFWAEKGPHTGQTSPAQLKDLKIQYCLVGHSEKREVGDTDEMVNAKVKACLEHKITPVLCVGFGTTVEQDDLEAADVLKVQLDAGLADVDASAVVVAYEPVWAISKGDPYATKKIATPEHAEKIAIFIKSKYGIGKVIYGGSANLNNAKGFLDQPNIDGLLPGGVSLIPSHFNQIINL
ncbi:MAG: triosephosphate isomerase [Candidatus Doudnabacteria bacterium]|nr:triosephosphate isomerase [Candidatus Doudnabacteria bacterium]